MSALTIKLILLAMLFVVTGGAVSSDYFKKHNYLRVLASIVAIVSAYYLFQNIVRELSNENNNSEQIALSTEYLSKIENVTLTDIRIAASGSDGIIEFTNKDNITDSIPLKMFDTTDYEWFIDNEKINTKCDGVCFPDDKRISPWSYNSENGLKNCKMNIYKYSNKLVFKVRSVTCDSKALNTIHGRFLDVSTNMFGTLGSITYREENNKVEKRDLTFNNDFEWFIDDDKLEIKCDHVCRPVDKRLELGMYTMGDRQTMSGCKMIMIDYSNKTVIKIDGSSCKKA